MTYLFRRPSGIYYFRKTYVLASGKRREVRRSLKTRDPKLAQYLSLKLFYDNSPAHVCSVHTDDCPASVPCGESSPVFTATVAPFRAYTQPETVQGLSLKAAIELFVAEKERGGSWGEKEGQRVAYMLKTLQDVLGDVSVTRVGKAGATKFKDVLLGSERSITTVNNYLKRASMLFEWLERREEGVVNVFKGLGVQQRQVVSTLRAAYGEADKYAYLNYAQSLPEWRKWVMLLLRYTGARPSEICQLYRDDIDVRRQTISIRQVKPDQSLKTPSSERTIPIHSKLISAGFLQFIAEVGSPRLFPELKRIKGTYSHNFVTWYSKQRDKARKTGQLLPELYGARHTAATEMKHAGIPAQYAAAVLGHSNNSITYDRYGKGLGHQWLAQAVESIGSRQK